jgi:hypothetical protein
VLVGIGIGLYEARAASTIKFDYYLTGKDVPKMADAFLNGYTAGAYDTLETVVWMATDDSQSKDDFTAANLAGYYQCLQKIPNPGETVAFVKDYWAKNPNVIAANTLMVNACQYKPGQGKANTLTGGGGRGVQEVAATTGRRSASTALAPGSCP